jgi:hypothetical protein
MKKFILFIVCLFISTSVYAGPFIAGGGAGTGDMAEATYSTDGKIKTSKGGTGQDSSAWDGCYPSLVGGVWGCDDNDTRMQRLIGLVIGTDVLAPNGSAASLTNFPTLNQNTTGTASALAANGANCSAGQAPLGVDAAGAVEGCFAVETDTGCTHDGAGNITCASYTTTRTDAAQYFKLYEATSDGNSSATFAVPAKGTGLAGDIDLTFSKSLSFTGTFTDGKLCTYASSGAVISCNTDAAGTGTMTTVSEDHVEVGSADVTQLNFGAGFDVADNGTIAEITLESTVVRAGVTEVTRYQYLPAAWFEDNATSPPAAAAVISGEEIKARLFADNETSIVLWQVDPEWSAGLKFRVYYSLVADGEADDTAIFRLKGCTIGNSEALTCTAGDPIGVTDEIGTDDDANQMMLTDWSDEVTLTGVAANELARLTFYRGEDDEAGELNVIGIELKYKAKVSAASDY